MQFTWVDDLVQHSFHVLYSLQVLVVLNILWLVLILGGEGLVAVFTVLLLSPAVTEAFETVINPSVIPSIH